LQQYFNLFVMYANLGKQITHAFTNNTNKLIFISDPVTQVAAGESIFSALGRFVIKCHINAL